MEEIEAVVGELRPNERADGPSPKCLTTSLSSTVVTITALSPGSADPLAWSLFLAENTQSPRKNVVSAALTSSGRSCWTQWPAPSINLTSRRSATRVRIVSIKSTPGR